MIYLLVTVHVLVCFFLIIVVLLQSGKAADLAGAFGGMGSQTAFGPRGAATVLSKATTVAAVAFMLTSLTLSIIATRQGGAGSSVLEKRGGGAAPAPAKGLPVHPAPSTPLTNIEIAPPGQKTGQPVKPGSQIQIPAPAPAPEHKAPAHTEPAGKK